MVNNPFISKTYQKIWIDHFKKDNLVKQLDFLEGLNFYKVSGIPLYVNCGKNMTNGITYHFSESNSFFSKNVFLIFDVPNYHSVQLSNNRFRLKKIPQYSGHLLNLENFNSFDSFFSKHFNSKSRSKFRGYFNKLEKYHVVNYEVLGDSITHEFYLEVMQEFKDLLEIRFDDLGVENDILTKWSFYLELVYAMIKDKKAILNLIRVDGKIGAISLAFLSNNSVIGAIKAFDIKYRKYSLGVLELVKLIEWTIDNDFDVFDFSKGDQDYKKRFASDRYLFECHVVYDTRSIKSLAIANILVAFYKFKQYLREKNLNTWYWKLKHKLKLN